VNHLTAALRVLRFAAVALVAASFLAVFTTGGDRELRADVFIAVAGGLGLFEALRWLRPRAATPSRRLDPIVRVGRTGDERRPGAPPSLLSAEVAVANAVADARSARLRFVPRLEALAARRLERTRSVSLTADPDAATAALGPAWARVTDAATGAVPVYGAPGLAVDDLDAVLRAMEQL
jgi:hypothetical protein